MRQLLDTAAQEETVSVGHILHVFGLRGFAFLMLMLALLNIVIFMVPFASVLFGLPMVILAAQMVMGMQAPIFPSWVRHQTIKREPLVYGLGLAISWVQKIERFIKPRALFLSNPTLGRVHGLLTLILAILVSLPIPLFNIPPSLAIAFLAIGMLQRDGLFIVGAYGLGAWCLALFTSLGHHLAHSLT